VQRIQSTVVVLVGTSPAIYDALATASNVRASRSDENAPPLDRAVDAWSKARETRVPYFVHDADPLAEVEQAWTRRYEGEGAAGELEIAVAATLARWRNGAIELPDYYLVAGADAWPATRRHWYFGVLAAASPNRVQVTEDAEVTTTLANLPSGRWWPELDLLLAGIDMVVPDRAGLPGEALRRDDAPTVITPPALEIVEGRRPRARRDRGQA
jgi:hypothetical protein